MDSLILRKWAVVAFGDIRGFGNWTGRAAASREVKDPFVINFYALMDAYVLKYRDVYFKRVGDGFMALKEFSRSDSKEIADFVLSLRWITRKARQSIENCSWPSPDGFRVRLACGDVYKIMAIDPNDSKRVRRIPEYVEYPTNTPAHLLVVNPEIVCLATEGVVNAMGKHRSIFRVRKLEKPSCYPESVNREDVNGLQILKF